MTATSARSELNWIAVDWGTSSLRLWALDAADRVIAEARSDAGMARLTRKQFEPTLLTLAEDCLGAPLAEAAASPVPVLICGMAGARQGWREAAYRATPCAPVAGDALTAAPVVSPDLRVEIIPGLSQADPPDVMRGEETQLAGLVAVGVTDGVACLPGTHSKWARLEGGRVAGFRTFMTGELFGLLGEHSILRHSLDPDVPADDAAFLAGVDAMIAAPEALTGALFSIRAADLLAQGAGSARSRLSGLLIGAELAAARPLWEGNAVQVIGADAVAGAYARALSHLGASPVMRDGRALALDGLRRARALTQASRQ